MQTGDIVALMAEFTIAAAADGNGDDDDASAASIFALCQQLQTVGPHLEQTNKVELARVFAVLRQTCCRDGADQLDAGCRRRIMELIELRAMSWRPKLSHTQYYLARNNSNTNNNSNCTHSNNDSKTETFKARNDSEYKKLACPLISELPAKEITAIQLNKLPVDNIVHKNESNDTNIDRNCNPIKNRNNFNNNNNQNSPLFLNGGDQRSPFKAIVPPPPPPSLFLPSPPLDSAGAPMAPNGYFVIPATGSWPTAAVQMISAAAAAIYPPPPPPPPLMSAPPPLFFRLPKVGAAPMTSPINLSTISGILNAKSIKSQQFREEVIIRNSDSGKIMGVKGRRVALIEELSRTVISFQKIDSKYRDRVLTVTGSTPEAIREARRLIDETIRRNVSPSPAGRLPPTSEAVKDTLAKVDPILSTRLSATVEPIISQTTSSSATTDTHGGVSIQRSADGSLRLCCDDPKVLEAAQTALCEYLNRAQPSRNSNDELKRVDENTHNDVSTSPLRYTRDEILALGDVSAGATLSDALPNEILRNWSLL